MNPAALVPAALPAFVNMAQQLELKLRLQLTFPSYERMIECYHLIEQLLELRLQ